ncbi:MAG: zinc ribbon domain-containing protein [Desulfobacterales bacterium]|nr:zinc ribbon domain-containing protein [Desulfobacterales bacterium]
MPVYEYECTKCGRIVETWQKFSDAPLRTCKECSGKLHKLISQSTFHLKGTGWYVTDYANKSTSSSSSSGKKAEKSKTKSSSSKKDG